MPKLHAIPEIVVIFFLLLSCKTENSPDKKPMAEFIESFKTEVIEPSGLALSYDKSFLWTVSDNDSKIYAISFDGEILNNIEVDGKDLEGVAVVDDSTLAVVCEREREIIVVDTIGTEIKRKKFDQLKGGINQGLEGLSYNSSTYGYFMVNEKSPCLLIELDADLEIIKNEELSLSSDLSGICYEYPDKLWIISDEKKLIAYCDLYGRVIDSFRVRVPQIEGIAVDNDKNKLYIISDATGELYVYNLLK